MRENFRHCLELLLEHEGGFVNHPRDPGGATNLGVTKRVYEEFVGRDVDIQEMRELTPDDVGPIYQAMYWDRIKGDELPSGVDWCVFDWAVNSGPGRAAKALQTFIGVTADGAIGPQTLQTLAAFDPAEVIDAMHAARQSFYESLDTFDTFGKGWTRRNNETLEQAKGML
jgi:lysozyme family protein